MNDQSPKFNQKTLKDSPNTISSPGSAGGPPRSELQDGQTTDLFGAPVALAPRSPSPASKRRALSAKAHVLCGALDELATQYAQTAKTLGLPMPATYGRKFGDSPLNTALDTSSESRLTALLPLIGSPLYQHRLKYSATPLGRRVYQLRASERPTSGSGFGGWPTPNAISEKRGGLQASQESAMRRKKSGHMLNLDDAAQLLVLGAMPNSSPAQMEKRGLLNPEFSRWLQGFPATWGRYAPTAMR